MNKDTIRHLDIYIDKTICIVILCGITGKSKEVNIHIADDKPLSFPGAGKLETVLEITPLRNYIIRS